LLPDGKPAQGAVVKLRDQTKDIRTAITSADGSFQFSRVLSDLDYQVRATLGNMESHHVSWSRLSDRKEKVVILILRPVRKPGKVSLPTFNAALPLPHDRGSVLALASGQVTYL
jgi:hypothetical protein